MTLLLRAIPFGIASFRLAGYAARPFGIASFRLAGYAARPFGLTAVPAPGARMASHWA